MWYVFPNEQSRQNHTHKIPGLHDCVGCKWCVEVDRLMLLLMLCPFSALGLTPYLSQGYHDAVGSNFIVVCLLSGCQMELRAKVQFIRYIIIIQTCFISGLLFYLWSMPISTLHPTLYPAIFQCQCAQVFCMILSVWRTFNILFFFCCL